MWFFLSVIVRIRMCDKLVLCQRESMENDMFTIRDLKVCRLRMIWIASELQHAELADQTEISIRTLQSYEERTRSVNKMNLETAYRFVKAMNVSIEDLVEVDEIQWKKQKTQRKATRNESAASIISPS